MERDAASVWRNSRAVAHSMSAVTMNIKNAVAYEYRRIVDV
jgi:hypothetical protein